MTIKKSFGCILALAALFTGQPTFAAPLITTLGLLPDDTSQTLGIDVNDNGLVLGMSVGLQGTDPFNRNVYHGVLYSSGTATAISTGQVESYSYDLNNNGTVVGFGINTVFSYSGAGPLQTIPNLAGANAVNDSGVIAGAIKTKSGSYQVVRLSPGGSTANLGTLGTDVYVQPKAINAQGTIVGYSSPTVGSNQPNSRAFISNASGTLQDFLSLPTGEGAEAHDINDAGVVVGYMWDVSPIVSTAFRYTGTLPVQNLPPLSLSQTVTTAYAINNAGFVVGQGYNEFNVAHAVLWRPNNAIVDLDAWLDQNDPTDGAHWTLQYAEGINSSGLIVGQGSFNGAERGFVLDATSLVPEPECGAIVGLVLLSFLSRRRSTHIHV